VITLDVIMPGLDGWMVLETLKDDPDLQNIPVVMLTVLNDEPMATSLGADDYMNKPVERQSLIDTLKKHIGGSSRPTEAP